MYIQSLGAKKKKSLKSRDRCSFYEGLVQRMTCDPTAIKIIALVGNLAVAGQKDVDWI